MQKINSIICELENSNQVTDRRDQSDRSSRFIFGAMSNIFGESIKSVQIWGILMVEINREDN